MRGRIAATRPLVGLVVTVLLAGCAAGATVAQSSSVATSVPMPTGGVWFAVAQDPGLPSVERSRVSFGFR